jgi:hypothetical protein
VDRTELAAEIAASLGIGTEMSLDRQLLRSVAGFAGLLGGAARRRPHAVPGPVDGAVWTVFASPVAHGAALAAAVGEALAGLKVGLVADSRHASEDLGLAFSFPGLAPASMVSVSNWRRLAGAVRLRLALPAGALRSLPVARLYREYLFLAQAVRYQAAEDALSGAALVLTDFDRDNYCRPLVWAAKQHGIPTMTLVHGTPNEINYVPVLADWVGVWGTAQDEWFRRHSPGTARAVIGRPEAEEFQRWAGPLRRVILCHSMEELSDTEVGSLGRLISELRDRGVACELRLHPKVRHQKGLGSWEPIAGLADRTELADGDFFAKLRPGDGVVAVTSSAVIQACVAGYPVAVVADARRVLPADVALVARQPGSLLELTGEGQEDAGVGASLEALRTSLVAVTGHGSRAALREAVEGILAQTVHPSHTPIEKQDEVEHERR